MSLKGTEVALQITEQEYGGKAIGYYGGVKVVVNHGVIGQQLRVRIKKIKQSYMEGNVIDTIKKSPWETEKPCLHFPLCGGCSMQGVAYCEQLMIKENQVRKLFSNKGIEVEYWKPVVGSRHIYGYRNKMEFSFGNQEKEGPLTLGMHQRGRRFDVVDTPHCNLVDEDVKKIRSLTASFFRDKGFEPYHRISHQGTLRHLVVRKGLHTGEILVNLVTASNPEIPIEAWANELLSLQFDGSIKGILWTHNDSVADVVKSDRLIVLYGTDKVKEKILGMTFTITPFSFFQTNSFGAEDLYSNVLELLEPLDQRVADLYCSLGTITQLVAKKAAQVTGIELLEESVVQARIDATNNGLDNCRFIAGDVKETLDKMDDCVDVIIVDPPRPGVHMKAMEELLRLDPGKFIYVSCNPKTLVENLQQAQSMGWRVKRTVCVDLFPHTPHVECVVLMSRVDK